MFPDSCLTTVTSVLNHDFRRNKNRFVSPVIITPFVTTRLYLGVSTPRLFVGPPLSRSPLTRSIDTRCLGNTRVRTEVGAPRLSGVGDVCLGGGRVRRPPRGL